MINLKKFFNNKKILVTGHTGFKGSWLVHWLSRYNVKILGIGLKPYNKLNLFKYVNKKKLIDKRIDVTDYKILEKNVLKFKPDIIYHLAAQSLVRKSIYHPLETFNTNIIGTANIIHTINKLEKKIISVIVTSDKCYDNKGLVRGYHENDMLGGHDPYSASKASAEIIFKSYFDSIIKKKNNVLISTARAGNVIGGGDWSEDRLIPDCIKAWSKNKVALIRNPNSTRPWQHVLEPLSGYIILSYNLSKNKNLNGQSFNFGPRYNEIATVKKILRLGTKFWLNAKTKNYNEKFFIEDKLLRLNSSKAEKLLNWKKILDINKTIELTMRWYRDFYNKKNVSSITNSDIDYFINKSKYFKNE